MKEEYTANRGCADHESCSLAVICTIKRKFGSHAGTSSQSQSTLQQKLEKQAGFKSPKLGQQIDCRLFGDHRFQRSM